MVAGRARDSSIGNVPTRAVVCEGKAKGAYCVGEMVPACSAAAAAILNLILAVPADSGVAPTCYTDFTEAAREYRARDRSIDNVPTRRVKEGKGGPLAGRRPPRERCSSARSAYTKPAYCGLAQMR